MHERDLLDWLSVAAVLAAALGAGLHATRTRRRRRQFVLLAAMLAFLAVDDALAVHEQVTNATAAVLDVSAHGDVLFLVPYLPLLAAAFFLLRTAARESPQPARRTITLGLVLLVTAIGIRAVAALASLSDVTLTGWQRTLGAAALHDTELLAWVLVAVGLALLPGIRNRAWSPAGRTSLARILGALAQAEEKLAERRQQIDAYRDLSSSLALGEAEATASAPTARNRPLGAGWNWPPSWHSQTAAESSRGDADA